MARRSAWIRSWSARRTARLTSAIRHLLVPLTQEHAHALVAWYMARVRRQEYEGTAVLDQLAGALDEAVSSVGAGSAFVRLSSRSPKDAAQFCPRFHSVFREMVAGVPDGDLNADAILFHKAIVRAMRVISGREALQLLSSSQRVYEDLTK
eukprot:TRINITY_DN5547_c0_g1_i6.p2 TRINITY_DN5547_c0_g1~~TRINITY_DN5547_c0_g1_i6.p2  ORF type:complete len:151 (+),score=19.32 TRINITY_DN5547_c0_g1_i6:333-785(+)